MSFIINLFFYTRNSSMNPKIFPILFFVIRIQAYSQAPGYELPFDDNWKFHLGDIVGAEKPSFDDKS
jgi:hypothetical protein